jgi:flagellar biosynthetic protein FliQ
MDEATLINMAQNALTIAILLAGPVLLVSLVIGSIISMLQAATQIQEVTLTFVPKVIGIIVVLVVLGGWMVQQLLTYTANVFMSLPALVR